MSDHILPLFVEYTREKALNPALIGGDPLMVQFVQYQGGERSQADFCHGTFAFPFS